MKLVRHTRYLKVLGCYPAKDVEKTKVEKIAFKPDEQKQTVVSEESKEEKKI